MLFILLFVFGSCGASKKNVAINPSASQALNLEDLILQKLVENECHPNSFTAKAKMQINIPGLNQALAVDIRGLKDSILWFSISPEILGISIMEAGRALITPDSIKIIDRINNVYYAKPFNYIQNYISYPINFSMLENLLLGNRFCEFNNSTKISVLDKDNNTIELERRNNELVETIKTDINNAQIAKITAKLLQSAPQIYVEQGSYTQINNLLFSNERHIQIKNNNVYTTNIQFNKVTFNENNLSFPFTVSSKYRIEK